MGRLNDVDARSQSVGGRAPGGAHARKRDRAATEDDTGPCGVFWRLFSFLRALSSERLID